MLRGMYSATSFEVTPDKSEDELRKEGPRLGGADPKMYLRFEGVWIFEVKTLHPVQNPMSDSWERSMMQGVHTWQDQLCCYSQIRTPWTI